MKEDWVPIQFPDNMEEMFEVMTSHVGDKIGWCLLSNSPIHTVAEMIPGTETHDCEQGRALEGEIESQKAKPRCKPRRRGRL